MAFQVQRDHYREVRKTSKPLFPTRTLGGSEVAPPSLKGGLHFQTSKPHQMRGYGA